MNGLVVPPTIPQLLVAFQYQSDKFLFIGQLPKMKISMRLRERKKAIMVAA